MLVACLMRRKRMRTSAALPAFASGEAISVSADSLRDDAAKPIDKMKGKVGWANSPSSSFAILYRPLPTSSKPGCSFGLGVLNWAFVGSMTRLSYLSY